MKVLEWSQQISHCKSMQIFYDAQRSEVGSTLKSNSSKLLWLSFRLVTCKNEEDPTKNEGARVVTSMLHYPSVFKVLKGSLLLNR